jgi:transposase
MYRDVAQWSTIRDRVLRKGISIRQVSRETGISDKTIRKMLDQTLPRPYGPRNHRYPKLGPYIASVQRMLRENTTLPPAARRSIKAIYEHIRDAEGFSGSYGSVSDYVRSTAAADKVCIWEYVYDLLASLEKKRAIDFLFLLSRANPPVISRSRTEEFFRDAGRVVLPRNPTGASRPVNTHSSGCAPSFRRTSTLMCFARRSVMDLRLQPCLTASTAAVYPTVTDQWSLSRAAVV